MSANKAPPRTPPAKTEICSSFIASGECKDPRYDSPHTATKLELHISTPLYQLSAPTSASKLQNATVSPLCIKVAVRVGLSMSFCPRWALSVPARLSN